MSFERGQPSARHTKVVDEDLRPLKSGQTHMSVSVCDNDAAPLNPTTPGRGVADIYMHILILVVWCVVVVLSYFSTTPISVIQYFSTFKQPPFLMTYLSVCCQFMLFVIFVSCKGTGCVGRVG